jgi:creatinine amidohydrolase
MTVDTSYSAPARLDRLPWPEVAAWLRRDPRVLLPVGTCLQHGPHLPLGTDTILVEHLASDVSRRTGILLAPTQPYGVNSDLEQHYAGTASLERKTLHRVLNELVESWERQGLEEIVLMTTHGYGPQIQAMAAVVSDLVRVRAMDIHAIDLSTFLVSGDMGEHGGEMDTSLLLYLAPELVNMDLAEDAVPGAGARSAVRDEPVPAPGSAGIVGQPSLASAENGKRMYDYLVDYIAGRLDA